MSKPKKDYKPDPKADELDGKIQTTGQEEASNVEANLSTPKSGTCEIKEVDEPKSAINTKRAAEVVTAGSDSSGIGGLRRGALSFSGGAGQTQGDESATTKESKPYKSGDRAGRRVDPITRKIDLIDAEIFKTKMYQSKPLAETTEGQGWTGNYNNEHVITQRNSGGAPADPLFERSIDEIDVDMLYYPAGQYNIAKGTKDLSIHTYDVSNSAYVQNPVTIQVGNFLARKLNFTIEKLQTGEYRINTFSFDIDDLSVDKIDEATYRLAGDAYMRDRNQRELDRNVIISKAGNESELGWSCLGDALVDATDQNRLQKWLDCLAGDFTLLSTRKLCTALSHQINKAAKDGSRIVGPMAEMVNGCIPIIGHGADASVSEENGRNYTFDPAAYVKGGAGLWLATNDSLPKYTTKGKLLTLPLSFKSAAATAISNMDPLVADDLLLTELKHNELYSTIDGPYDPLKPVVITDKAAIVYPIPLDVHKSGVPLYDTTNYKLNDEIYTMHYENLRNKYNIKIRNFFVAGIFRWIKERAERLYENCKTQAVSNVVTFEIPVVSSTTSLSLWDLLVCSSVPYICEERVIVMTELLKYERNHGYPYSGVSHLKDMHVCECDNFTYSGFENPISVGIAKPVAAMKVMMPEVFWPVAKKHAEEPTSGNNGIAVYTILPHYFVQNQFEYAGENGAGVVKKLVLSDEGASMAYPSVRSGNMFSYFDTVYGMTEEDYRLSLDRMVNYPGYQPSYTKNKIAGIASVSGDDQPFPAYTYKYGLTCDGNPVIPYFGYADAQAGMEYILTVKDIVSTPRELGLFQIAPAGLLSPVYALKNGNRVLNTVALTSSYLALSGPGFKAKIYHGVGNEMENSILTDGSLNISANASLRNNFITIDANPYNASTDFGCLLKANVSTNAMTPFVSGSYEPGVGSYSEDTGIYQSNEQKYNGISLTSDFKYLWTRLQRLFFIINPFDCNGADVTSASNDSWDSINRHDIYDMLYMFGFAGYRASNFKELVYQRVKERVAKGMNYVNDPFVTKSLLLK